LEQVDDAHHATRPADGRIWISKSLARIHGGVHYRFDQQAGQQVGVSVAEYVFAHTVRPRNRWSD
jgi:hypothetical protein